MLRTSLCWKKRYQLISKSSWPWVVPGRPWVNTPLKIPPPAALVEGVLLRWFILSCEHYISISTICAQHATSHIQETEKIRFSSPKIQFSSYEIRFTKIGFLLSSTAFRFLQRLSDFLQWLSAFSNGFPIFFNGFPISLNSFPLFEKSKKIYLRQEVYKRSLFELCIFCHSLSHSRSKLRNTRYNTQHTPVVHLCSQQCAISKI